MELELGLKITRTREDVSSSVDFRFSKDPFGPLVLSRETDSRFIIIIHLKGFKKEGVEIEINKEGNRITIRGRKPVEEMVLIRWMAWKKEVELRAFRKVFLIPDIVDLDKIKARFDDDDATLTITMPKRVKGISGFKLEEEEEEEEEESTEYGDVSEAETIEETQNREEVQEDNVEREESGEHSENQREEEFGEMMEDKERESQIFKGEEEGFIKGLDEEETRVEEDDLEKIQQIDEQDKNLEFAEKETVGQQELAESNTVSEDSSLRKLPDIIKKEDNQEGMEKQVETQSEGTESRAVEEIEKQEHDELDRTSKNRATEKKTTDGDDDGLSKAQGIEEPERHNEESKIQYIVEEETGGQEMKKIGTMEIKNKDAKEEFDGKMGEGFTPKTERTGVVAEDTIAETETNADEFESEKPEADEVDKKHELVERKEEEEGENDNVKSLTEDGSLIKLQEKQEPDEQLDRTSKGGATEKKTTDDDGDGLSKVQGIEEPERHSEGSKAQDMVGGKGREEKKKIVRREIKNGDAKEDVDAKMREGFTPNIDRTQVVGEDEVAETETKSEEFVSDKQEADEVDMKHELVEKKEEKEENANVGKKSEDRSLIKLQENEEQHSKGRKRQDKQENLKELMEEKTPDAETNTANDIPKPVQETEAPEVDTSVKTPKKKKSVNLEVQNRDAKEEVDANTGVPNTTEAEPEDLGSDKLEADEVDKIHELVERNKEEQEKNAKVGTQSTDISLTKPQEIEEQQSQGQKRHNKHDKIKELVEKITPEAEKNIGNGTPKAVQERSEEKHKIQKLFQEEAKKQPEKHKEKMVETGKKVNDAAPRKVQEIVRQQELDDLEMYENERKPEESMKSKTNDEEKDENEIAETETKEQEPYRPKILGEQETIQELAEEKTGFLKNGDISRKVGDNQQRDSDAKDEIDAEMDEGLTPNIGETETKAEEFETHKLEPDEVDEMHELVEKKEEEEENTKVRRQSEDRSLIKLQENETQHSKGHKRQEKSPETETNIPKPVQETEVPEVDTLGKTGDEGKEGKEKKKILATEIKDGYPEEEVDAKNGKGFATNSAETETKPEEFESDDVDEIHELVEKKEEEEDNAKVRKQIEESSLNKKLQETEEQQNQAQKRHDTQEEIIKELVEEKTPTAETNIANQIPKPVQETENPEVDTLETSEEKEFAETETKEQGSFGPKILEGEDKIQKLAEDKMNLSRKVEEEKETAEKITESGDDDMSRKVRDIEQRSPDAMEGQEEKNKIQELVLEEEVSDDGKGIVAEAIAENDKSRKAQEIDEKQPHEEDKRGNQFQKLIGGETSGHGEVEDVENEKKTTEADKRFRDSAKEAQEIERQDSNVSTKYAKGDTFQEFQECRTTYQNEQEEEKEDEADRHEKVTGTIEQELVHLNSQVEQNNVEDGEETQELVEDKSTGYKEEESEIKTDDVIRKVQGTKEQELFEPKMDHVSKTKNVVEGKIAESETKAERGGLSKIRGTEEQELHEPNIHKERYKTKINGTEEPSGQEKEENEKIVESVTITEKENSTNAQEIREERPDKPESHEKQYKVQEPVEAGHNDHKEDPKDENLIAMAKPETEEDSSNNVQEIEKKEFDGSNRSIVQDKMQESEEKEITRAMQEEEIVDRTKNEDGSLRKLQDDADPELRKHYKRQEEDKIQEPAETGTSGHGEVEDMENEKKTTEADKRFRDSAREAQEIEKQVSDVSAKYGKGDTFQKLQESRTTYQNEQDEADRPEKVTGTIEQELFHLNSQVEQDNVEDGEETRELVEDKTTDGKEEESEIKTDDVVRKVQGIKEQELFEPKMDHVSKIEEVVEEKIVESEIEAECGGLSKEHEPNIHKERDKTKINGTEEPSGKENEKIVESMTLTEKETQEIREGRGDKPESHEKQFKVQEPVEAGHNDQKDENLIVKTKRETEEDSSKKVPEIEKQESDGSNESTVQDKIQEKEVNREMQEKEIVERTRKEDGSLRKLQDGADPELSKAYKRQEEDKIQEPVETGTSDYREKVSKPNLDEFERHGEQRNIPQLVDEEKVENIAEPGGKQEDDNSGKFHEFEEPKSYDDWTQEEREKIKDLKHTGGEGHTDHKEEKAIPKAEVKAVEDSSAKVQEIEKQESGELQRSLVQDKMQETEEEGKTRAVEKNEIVEGRTKTEDGSLRKVREGEDELGRDKRHEEEDRIQELVETDTSDHREKLKKKDEDDILRSHETGKLDLGELERYRKERKIQQPVEDEKGEGKMENISEPGGQKEGDSSGEFHEFQIKKTYEDCRHEDSEEIGDLVKAEAAGRKDKHTGGKGEHEEERYEKVPQANTKAEDELNKKVGESEKEEENLVDYSTTKIQETETEESHESEIHEKLDIVQDFVEDETGDQEDKRAGEAAAVVANNEKDSSRKLHSIEGEEVEEHKEQDEIPETSNPRVKEEDGERVAKKEAHTQEVEGKTENCKDDDGEVRRGEKGKQEKTFQTKSDDGIVRNIRETSVEPGEKIEELERKKKSNHEVELVTEDDSLRKGQEFLENELSNVSKREPVEQEKIQQLKDVGKREDEEKPVAETKTNAGKSRKLEMQELDEAEENEEMKMIRKPMEEETNAPEKEKGKEGNEKPAEEEMQAKKDQETQRQEPYVPEPVVEMADREIEEMRRKPEDVSSRKVRKVKAEESDGLEKQRKLDEIRDKQPVEEKIQEHGEEELDVRGGYKAVLKTKSMEDSSQSQDVEEKGSDQTERYAEQEKIQELMVKEEGKEEYDIREGKQNEKATRIPQVEPKANDDSSKKSETERLRGQKQNEDHQELAEVEKSDQRKEEREDNIVGKGETIDHEYKVHEHEEGKSDKLERHEEEEMSGSLGKEKTSNDIEEENRGNRARAETNIRDDGFEEEELAIVVRHREQDKKRSFVEKDTTGNAKENKNQETKSRDDSSIKTQENEKQESHEQKRNFEEQEKKDLGPNYCRDEEDGKEDTETAEAEGPRKLKGIEKRESTKMVERHENQDNINELVEEKMNNQEGEDKEGMSLEVLAKSEDHEAKGPEGLRKKDKSRELVQQRLRDNLEDEETTKTETKSKDNEARKIHQAKAKETGEEERRKEQERIKELVEDRTHYCREKEYEDVSSKKISEIDKEELTEPRRNEKRDEIEEPVDKEASEDDEEELEVEVEDSEEDWEAEVVQEMDSDEDTDKIRQIRRIKLGFRIVGGSTLFMSLIVIVISFIRSKRKIRCYKF